MRLIYIHRVFFAGAITLNAVILSLYLSDIAIPQLLVEQLAFFENTIPKIAQYKTQLQIANQRFEPYMICIVAVNVSAGPLSILCQAAAMNVSRTYRRFKIRQFTKAFSEQANSDRFWNHPGVLVIGAWGFLVVGTMASLWMFNEGHRKAVHLHHSVFQILLDLGWTFMIMGCGNFLVLFFWSDRTKKVAELDRQAHGPVSSPQDRLE